MIVYFFRRFAKKEKMRIEIKKVVIFANIIPEKDSYEASVKSFPLQFLI